MAIEARKVSGTFEKRAPVQLTMKLKATVIYFVIPLFHYFLGNKV